MENIARSGAFRLNDSLLQPRTNLQLHLNDLADSMNSQAFSVQRKGRTLRMDRSCPNSRKCKGEHYVGNQRQGCRNNRGKQRKDRKSTRLNSSHSQISYAVFCLKKKKAR